MRLGPVAAVLVSGAMLVAGCTVSDTTTGGGRATVEKADGGEVAGAAEPASTESSSESGSPVAGTRDSKSNCYFSINDDPTADVRLYNKIQRAGVTADFGMAGSSETDTGIWMENYQKYFENGAAWEGAFECAAVPYMVENNSNQTYYWWDGKTWTDHPGWWGHTKELSGDDEPLGWVRFQCRGKPVNRNTTPAPDCPDSALSGGYVQANWNTEGDNEKELYKKPNCVSTNPVIGCWTNSYYGGEYDGQFVFDTTAWTAPLRATLTTSAQDDKGNLIVWKITTATASSAKWSRDKSPEGQLVKPGSDSSLVVGAYAEASRGDHSITLTLTPVYTVDASGNPQKCTTAGTSITCTTVPDASQASKPILSKAIIATVSLGLTLWKGEGNDGTPKVEKVLTSCTYNQKTTKSRTFDFDCVENGKPFTYGGNWSVSMKTTL